MEGAAAMGPLPKQSKEAIGPNDQPKRWVSTLHSSLGEESRSNTPIRIHPGTPESQPRKPLTQSVTTLSEKTGVSMRLAGSSGSGESASSKLSAMLTERWTDMTAEPAVGEGSAGDTEADLTGYFSGVNATSAPESTVVMSLWPGVAGVAMALLLTALLLGIFIWRCKKKETPGANKKDLFLDDCVAGDIPAPVFEDDIPSVLELDMEDLDKWEMKTSNDRYKTHD